MINVDYQRGRNLLRVEFKGDVAAEEAKATNEKIDRLTASKDGGLTLVVDFSGVNTMDPEVENEVKRSMKMLAGRGLEHVVRVLPDPAADFGFDTLERFYYPNGMDVHTVRSPSQTCDELSRLH